MKNRMSKITFAAMAAVLVLGMTGCGKQGGDTVSSAEACKPAVAYMIARTANAKPADSSAPLVQDTMINCANNYGYSYIVRVDGEPELVSAENLDIDEQFKNASGERLKRDALNRATNLLNVMDEVSAVYPEVDYMEGLRCAAASLHSLDDSYTSRSIICCGTGLGTRGYMDFQNNLLSAEPDVIVEMLKEREALPDLEGIIVYWLGMGQVAAPQEKLTPKQSKNLESIWKAVIEASGGEFVPNEYITVSTDKNSAEGLPSVSIVEIPSEIPMAFEPEALEAPVKQDASASAFEEPVSLDESQVEFVGNQSVYLHPENAVETIRPIAEYLIEHDTVPLLLIGSTAGDITSESDLQLSKDRAEMVKNTLVTLGADASRITAIGMGSDDPWHVYNAGYDGTAASGNRKVVLIDARTELAMKLMNEN
ncbi:MAG: OmpA family protein [Eubacteriales bacterium]|nr:OmpA family protein [Eubacteriales bacterium]